MFRSQMPAVFDNVHRMRLCSLTFSVVPARSQLQHSQYRKRQTAQKVRTCIGCTIVKRKKYFFSRNKHKKLAHLIAKLLYKRIYNRNNQDKSCRHKCFYYHCTCITPSQALNHIKLHKHVYKLFKVGSAIINYPITDGVPDFLQRKMNVTN